MCPPGLSTRRHSSHTAGGGTNESHACPMNPPLAGGVYSWSPVTHLVKVSATCLGSVLDSPYGGSVTTASTDSSGRVRRTARQSPWRTSHITAITRSTLRGTLRTLPALQPRIRQPPRRLLLRPHMRLRERRRHHRRLKKLVHFRSPFTRGIRPAHTADAFTGCSFRHSENTGHSVRHTLRAVRHRARAWKRSSPSYCGSHRKPFSGIAHGPTPSAARATTFSSTAGSSIARRRLADASRNVRRFASTHASQGFSPRFRC